ncbi:MAG: DUF1573 domain-containing protein [Candidatus Omnitrophota bacterium]
MPNLLKPKTIFLSFLCFAFFSQAITGKEVQSAEEAIYSKLQCCTCDVSFNTCNCPEAKEIKILVDALIETGVRHEDIFYKVAKKFSLATIRDEKVKALVKSRMAQEAGKKRPQLVLEAASFNFGKVRKKQGEIRKSFKVYNKGNSDLVITNIRVSCSCVGASLRVGKDKSPYFGIAGAASGWQAVITPGKSGVLEVLLDVAHPSMTKGRQVRDIFIASNDPLYSEVALRIEADVHD